MRGTWLGSRCALEGEETARYWTGLEFDSAADANQLDFVEIRYAGAGSWYGGADASGAIYRNVSFLG